MAPLEIDFEQFMQSIRKAGLSLDEAILTAVSGAICRKAQCVEICSEGKKDKRGHSLITSLTIIHDGLKQDPEESVRSLTFSRHSDQGAFAAYHLCNRVELYSRDSSSEWIHTYFDYEEIASSKNQLLSDPAKKDPPEDLVAKASDMNFVIIWSQFLENKNLKVTMHKATELIKQYLKDQKLGDVSVKVDGVLIS